MLVCQGDGENLYRSASGPLRIGKDGAGYQIHGGVEDLAIIVTLSSETPMKFVA